MKCLNIPGFLKFVFRSRRCVLDHLFPETQHSFYLYRKYLKWFVECPKLYSDHNLVPYKTQRYPRYTLLWQPYISGYSWQYLSLHSYCGLDPEAGCTIYIRSVDFHMQMGLLDEIVVRLGCFPLDKYYLV